MITKKFSSLLMKRISKELYIELMKLTMLDIDNNSKGFELKRLLTEYGVEYSSLGSGTNRFGILIDGYAVKFALDNDGMIDNKREFLYSQKLYPYVIKCYECYPNGLAAVTEYVDTFTPDMFNNPKTQAEMRKILTEISNFYLVGDVGITTKNYLNWGIRHGADGDSICIMDYAYIYAVSFGVFKCSCTGGSMLKYDKDFVNFICPDCGRRYTFGEMRRKVTRKKQDEEIGDISKIGYVIHQDQEELPVNPEFSNYQFTSDESKNLTHEEIEIKKHEEEQKDLKRQELMFDYPEIYDELDFDVEYNGGNDDE